MKEKIVQTAGKDALGDFAPSFARYNDEVLFGENWNDDSLDIKTRCLITVVTLVSQGIADGSLRYHISNAKARGVGKKEMAGAITHVAFYAGWPKAWAAFNIAKEVYGENEVDDPKAKFQNEIFFPIGEPNPFGKYFTGQSYLCPLSEQVPLFNVTFEPSCRNNWHIHRADEGGGQTLICVGGEGYYQEWGKEARSLKAGDVVNIPANVKHWHGAKKDSWFSHLALEVAGKNASTEWLEEVSDEDYYKLK